MSKPITRKATNFYLLGESILNLVSLPLGLVSVGMAFVLLSRAAELPEEGAAAAEELQAAYDPSIAAMLALLFFLVLAAARVIRSFRLREKKGEGFFRLSLAQAGVFAVCGALPMILGYTMESTFIVSVFCALALAAGRIYSIVKDHRVRNIIPNAAAILVIAYCALSFVFMAALLFLISVMALMAIVFSRISFSVLQRIVVKTHAAEIIFGLILLIVTFSLLLTFFEPGMGSFKDALWYCFAIVTTIGFGDLTAVTDFGRVLSVILGAYGIIVVALITSIIVNFYGEMKVSPETDSSDTLPAGEGQGEA